jgi:AraC family transcriptional regulator
MTSQASGRLVARHVRRTVTRAGLHAFEAVYEPNTRLPNHEHASPFFTYVLRGDYVERAGRLIRECRRGTVSFHPAHESHADVVGPRGTRSLNVELAPDVWRELDLRSAPPDEVSGRVLGGDIEWLAFAVWREFHRDDAASVLGMNEAVALLCAAVHDVRARGMFVPNKRLDRCAELLTDQLVGAPTLSGVAEEVGLHPVHLARIFRRRFGCSMGEFVRRRRIAWACEQLERTGETIARVASRAGFADHAHFTRTFRRITGTSPRWYRERLR